MSATPEKVPRYYSVPPGKVPKLCKFGCGVMIYLIRSPDRVGVWIPVHCDPEKVERGRKPTETLDGWGINHWSNCPKSPKAKGASRRPPEHRHADHEQRALEIDQKPRTCIICGCTAATRCKIPKEKLDAVEQDIQVGRYDVVGPSQLPAEVDCYFLQLDPPVCSACKSRRNELPLHMRAGVRPSEISS